MSWVFNDLLENDTAITPLYGGIYSGQGHIPAPIGKQVRWKSGTVWKNNLGAIRVIYLPHLAFFVYNIADKGNGGLVGVGEHDQEKNRCRRVLSPLEELP